MKKDIYIRINRLKIKISTDNLKYQDYLKTHFNKVLTDDTGDVNIFIDACWQKLPLRVQRSDGSFLIGGNTALKGRQITTIRKIARKKKIKLDFNLKDRNLYVYAQNYFKPFKDLIRYTLLGSPQESYFFELTYVLVYYPVFWYLEYFHNTHLIHASCVKSDDKGIVICGMEGVGKTTLSLVLRQQTKGEFLSDNLVFYDEARVYPCYEPVRLHKNADKTLWNGSFKKINQFRTLKDFYEPEFQIDNEGVRPYVFLQVGFSKDFYLKELPGEVFISRVLNSSNLIDELGNYSEYASIMNMMAPDERLLSQRQKTFEVLIKGVKCFELGLDTKIGPLNNFFKLKEKLGL